MSGTIRDLITGAAQQINIIAQNAVLNAADMKLCLYALNNFADSCSNNRLLIFGITEFQFPLTGAGSYTLGLGGDWNISRPMKIEYAYARLNPGTQQQLDIAMQPLTVAQYAGIAVKNTPSTFPFAYYDDNSYPLRTISLFPVPQGPANIVLWLREPLLDMSTASILLLGAITQGTGYVSGFYQDVPLGGGSGNGAKANITVANGLVTNVVLTEAGQNYAQNDTLTASNSFLGGSGSGFSIPVAVVSATLDDPINFPPGYERFFRFNLALEISSVYGKSIPDNVMKIADQSRKELERLNMVPQYLRGDGCMTRGGRNRYFNYITGGFFSFQNNC